MKLTYILILAFIATSCKTAVKPVMTIPMKQNAKLTLISETLGLSHAESVAYDPNYNRLYVSVQGEQVPGDGGIATIDLEGNMINKNFTTGLNNPKGIAIAGDWIYVSDVTELIGINRETGEILKRYTHEDAKFLNDVAVDENNDVYVSDMGTSSIFKLDDNKFIKWLSTPELENPNGLLAVGNNLYVASWGLPGSENAEGNTQGRLLKLDLNTKNIEQVTAIPLGNLDGIQVYDDQHFLVSDWRKGVIYKISKSGIAELFLTSEASVGDILYIQDQQLLALPLNRQNKVQIFTANE
ncbi:SMP-30/gluconolactonase/LRE family protein [Nonlabens marinus]|nr:hypothetical protein [Nonlabens marinus]